MDMNNLLKKAQQMQQEMAKAQATLADIKVEATAGGGMVKVVANCKLEILSVSIEDEVISPDDKEMLEDLVAAAINQAIKNAQERAAKEMQNVTGGMLGGLNLPDNFKMPGM